jgi:hypothetical protein
MPRKKSDINSCELPRIGMVFEPNKEHRLMINMAKSTRSKCEMPVSTILTEGEIPAGCSSCLFSGIDDPRETVADNETYHPAEVIVGAVAVTASSLLDAEFDVLDSSPHRRVVRLPGQQGLQIDVETVTVYTTTVDDNEIIIEGTRTHFVLADCQNWHSGL